MFTAKFLIVSDHFVPEGLLNSLAWWFNSVHKLWGQLLYSQWNFVHNFRVQSHNPLATVWWSKNLWNETSFHKLVATSTHMMPFSLYSSHLVWLFICLLQKCWCVWSSYAVSDPFGMLCTVFLCDIRRVLRSIIHLAPGVVGKGSGWVNLLLRGPNSTLSRATQINPVSCPFTGSSNIWS